MPSVQPYPLVSVGVTCYNASDTIARAIASAVSQEWPNLEILVVDDASTDACVDIVASLAAEDARIRLICHSENLGVGAARNTVLSHAEGEWVTFFDDDDISEPNRIERQHQRILQYEHDTGERLVLSFCARTQVFPDGTRHYEPTLAMDRSARVGGEAVANLILLGQPIPGELGSLATCSLMARKEVFQAIGGFDPALRRGEDTEFNLRFALKGGQFAGLSEPLVTQFMTFTSDKSFEEELNNILQLLETHRAYLEAKGWYGFSVKWFRAKREYLERKRIVFLLHILQLVFQYPRKLACRMIWSWPNRTQYKRLLDSMKAAPGPVMGRCTDNNPDAS